MQIWVLLLKIAILFLLLSSSFSERGLGIVNRRRTSKERARKGDVTFEDAMDVEEDEVHNFEQGVIYIENATLRPFSIVCWNQNLQQAREPKLNSMEVFEHKFPKHLSLYWDCTVASIDETIYIDDLEEAIGETFRAWTSSTHHLNIHHTSQTTMNPPSIMFGPKCNKCYWLLKNRGIYHIWGDPRITSIDQYSFVFDWDTRGHKRGGDPLSSGRHKQRCDLQN